MKSKIMKIENQSDLMTLLTEKKKQSFSKGKVAQQDLDQKIDLNE